MNLKAKHRGIYLGITSIIGIFSSIIVARGGDLSSLNPFYGVGNQTRCKVNINQTLATNDHVYRIAGGKKNVAPYYRNFSVVVPNNGTETKFQMVSNKMLNLPNGALLTATSDSTDTARDREGNCSGDPADYCDSWSDLETAGAPIARNWTGAAWTGSKFFVFGGNPSGSTYINDGTLFDPITNSWTAVTSTGAPSVRYKHSVVWTGTKAIVWGGKGSLVAYLNTGALYDPSTDSWAATTTTGVPAKRYAHAAIWTGTEMVIYGGYEGPGKNTGGKYNPSTDSWTATTTTGAPLPRGAGTAEKIGGKLVIWGGTPGLPGVRPSAGSNTGAIYDPSANSWTAMTTTGTPSIRQEHISAVDNTGGNLFVFGGVGVRSNRNDGGKYNVSSDSWTPITSTGAPANGGQNGVGVWLSACSKALFWSGGTLGGAVYSPGTDTWTLMSTVNQPVAGSGFGSAWIGDSLLVFPGSTTTNAGGRYFPCCQ